MAQEYSFDVVSKVDMQEVDNAINQTKKEISQRYDFKSSKSQVTVEKEEIKIIADNEFMLKSVIDILQTKLIRRNVAIKNLEYGKIEQASGGLVRQLIKIKQGIQDDKTKDMVKDIKNLKLKIQSQIMGDQVRITGKNKDDLQEVIKILKQNDYGQDLQFINYR